MSYLKCILDKGAITTQGSPGQHTHPGTSQGSPHSYTLLESQLLLQAYEGLRRYLHAWRPVDF